MLIPFFYAIGLFLVVLVAIPRLLYHYFIHRKYRNSLWARLGLIDQSIKKKAPILIWVHAVSVGETKAIAKLSKVLKERFLDHCQLIISSVTETGHAEAKRSIPFADAHIYLPFDFPFSIGPLVAQLSPDLVVLCESDFWYNFLRYSKNHGAHIALVNGKLSERSQRRFRFLPAFSQALFGTVDTFCVQNRLYLDRFLEIGVSADKMVVTGNLKFDEDYPVLSASELSALKMEFGIEDSHRVICAGSTHHDEEQLILTILKPMMDRYHIKLILVPRHPERFESVAHLLETAHIPFIRYSQIEQRSGQEKVILIDAMGVLRTCYQLCDFALVGGSFVDHVGGHNILEPCWYGKPVIYGPNMHSQPELVELIKEYNAGKQVSKEGLRLLLNEWLTDSKRAIEIGQNGKDLAATLSGSLQKTLSVLQPVIDKLQSKLIG